MVAVEGSTSSTENTATEAPAPSTTSKFASRIQERAQAVLGERFGQIRNNVSVFEDAARTAWKKRYEGSKAEELVRELPTRVTAELDSLLDRVGLVRKARMSGAAAPSASAPAANSKGEAGRSKANTSKPIASA